MSVYITEDTKIITQGATGQTGRVLIDQLKYFGTSVVAGVSPGHEGEQIKGVPIYNTVESTKPHSPDTSLVAVGPGHAKAACIEAIEAGIETVVIVTEGVPIQDTIEIIEHADRYDVTVIGPNSVGVISPGKGAVMLAYEEVSKWYKEGHIGIVARSGSIAMELANQLTQGGIGQSTVLSVGGDPYLPTTPADVLRTFDNDPETAAAIYVGEIGSQFEAQVANVIEEISLPVYSSVVGQFAPAGKEMGHAGAVADGMSAKDKISMIEESGGTVARSPFEIIQKIEEELK